jgi:hypothetical protein
MADGVNESSRIVRAVDEGAADPLPGSVRVGGARRSRPSFSPHSHKFMAVTAALAGVAVGAIVVALVVLLSSHPQTTAAQWSQWSPPDQGLAGEREIAAQVAPFYRAAPANQLVVVTVQNINASTRSTSTTSSASSGGLQLALRDPTTGSLSAVSGSSAVYNLCGLGANCSIDVGTPSSARLLLLRREALELALYTLRYINGVDNVVAILPPGRTGATAQLTTKPPKPGQTAGNSTVNLAVVFQRTGLQRYLSRPLGETLPEPLPPTVTQMPGAPEAELVSVLTGESLFAQQRIQSQDGSNVLVLSPVPPQ